MDNARKNKLGEMPVGKLLISMSIPMMISFFIQALYNIVDSMFVARISESALTAVSIAFPVQQVITAIGVGTGVGINALVPRFTGQGNLPKARQIANIAIFLSACYVVLFLVIGLTCIRKFYTMQTDVQEIVEAGVSYLTIICTISAGAFFSMCLEKMLVATGNTIHSMIAQGVGAIFNLIFDPLLIFGIGPFPALGVRGAAIATVGGQIVAAILALYFMIRKEKTITLRLRDMVPTWDAIRSIYAVGIPSMITVGLGSVMSFCINQILLTFSTTATAVFGIWMKLQNFSNMPVIGMNNGTTPILAFNYGAGKLDRVKQTIRIALTISLSIMAVLVVVYELIPDTILRLFNASEHMMSIGEAALRTAVTSLPFGAVCFIYSSAFQALGHSRFTLVTNICRQLVFIVPTAWLLSLSGRLNLVWLSIPICDFLSAVLASVLKKKLNKDLGL